VGFRRGCHGAYGTCIGGEDMITKFHGVRGSTACHGEDTARYGGNTSCVSVSIPGHEPLLFDLGTGLRYFGTSHPAHTPFRGSCLLTHLHWDHVQGLPFFQPLLHPDAVLDVYAPPSPDTGETVGEVMARTIHPPLFPVTLEQFPGTIRFHDVADDEFTLAGEGADAVTVMSRLIPHFGSTCGFRVTWNGRTVSYLSDHQQPIDGSFAVTPGALELCQGADVLIHDAQFTAEEFRIKSNWGHCTVEYAVWLAGVAGVRTLVLFHHDPNHDDEMVDRLAANAAACGRAQGIEVIAAFEGMTLKV
jgi:phosphoribosyl 1,2-cyclic phosphodiesterase